MFDNTSDYALNKKDKDSIVYKGCDGYEQRITREHFASEEEFLFWKSWSDEDYHATDNADTYYLRHIVGMDTLDGKISIASQEDTMIEEIERTEQIATAKEIVKSFMSIITEVQFRRIWYHFALGLKVRVIAKQEGVAHPNIVKSIVSAKKIILKNAGSEGTKTHKIFR